MNHLIDWFLVQEEAATCTCKLCNQSFSCGLLNDSSVLLKHLCQAHNVTQLPLTNTNITTITNLRKQSNTNTTTSDNRYHSICNNNNNIEKHKGTRVWSDGCYDMVHFGHANQLRQTKAMGDYLVVGVHSDAEIEKHKGPPVFSQEERYKIVKAIKWVDEVVEDAPYITSLETLAKYDCDFCVHGSDITTDSEGLDTYRFVKAAGKYKECQRTIGVSTTDLVDRMLKATNMSNGDNQTQEDEKEEEDGSSFLPSTRKIVQFANSDGKGPKEGDRVVYVAGAFDIFHVAHVDFLEKVRKLGDYVIVGLHSDRVIRRQRGNKFPIMNLQERVLSVLACKYVDEVVMEAPYSVSNELIDHFRIDFICHGKTSVELDKQSGRDPYEVPKSLGKYVEVDSGNGLTTEMVVERILNKRNDFIKRNLDKEAKASKPVEAKQQS